MKLNTSVKLLCSDKIKKELRNTLKICNEVSTEVSDVCFDLNVFSRNNIHKLLYYQIRDCYDLPAQFVIRLITKVVQSYKKDTKTVRTFKSTGAIAYDARILRWKDDSSVSIHTGVGRRKIQFECGERQRELLKYQKGETDLVLRRGEFYLYTTCDVPETALKQTEEFLGIDRGVNNIAADSLGELYSGNKTISVRKKYSRLRRKLQKVGTKSAKRKLSKNRRKESRFSNNVNHCISKEVVSTALRHNLGIALEDLKGIRKSITVRKGHRYVRHSWGFYDLEQKILYKAKLLGVYVVKVDPRNTSRECSACGCVDKRNRRKNVFRCTNCGYTDHADTNAARVIASRASVNRPIVGITDVVNSCSSLPYKPLPSGRGG